MKIRTLAMTLGMEMISIQRVYNLIYVLKVERLVVLSKLTKLSVDQLIGLSPIHELENKKDKYKAIFLTEDLYNIRVKKLELELDQEQKLYQIDDPKVDYVYFVPRQEGLFYASNLLYIQKNPPKSYKYCLVEHEESLKIGSVRLIV
jgi:hypothetical protein